MEIYLTNLSELLFHLAETPVTEPSQVVQHSTSWWFQTVRKILVKLDHFPNQG